MFKSSSVADEVMLSMEKELLNSYAEDKYGFNKLAQAIDCLNAAADIFDKSGLHNEANDVTEVIQSLTDKIDDKVDDDWEDELSGGLADNKSPKDFNSKSLIKGLKVEMEHTDDKRIALEIAMDHLTEDPAYYEKLEIMES